MWGTEVTLTRAVTLSMSKGVTCKHSGRVRLPYIPGVRVEDADPGQWAANERVS